MSTDIHCCNGIKLVWRDTCQRCSLFSPQKKASLQQEITGHLSHRELEAKLSEMEGEIKRAKGEQERYQKIIDGCKQGLQDTSQKQDKGRTHVYWHQSCSKDV